MSTVEGLPTNTDFRFALVIAAVLGSSLFIYNLLNPVVAEGELATRIAECADHLVTSRTATLDELSKGQGAFDACVSSVKVAVAGWTLGGLGLLVAVALALYLLLPSWRRARRRMRPLGQDLPEIQAFINQLAHVAGLRRPPQVRWDPVDRSSVGVAYGLPLNYSVDLTGGLVARFRRERDVFSAVVLHELAHIRNGDVEKTYLAITTWYAFVLVALIPFAVTLVTQDRGWGIDIGWRVAVLALLVLLLRNAILRSREIDADLQAAAWQSTDALRRAVASLRRSSVTAFASTHPHPLDRLRALDGMDLRRFTPRDAFAVGLITSVSLPPVTLLLFHLTDATSSQLLTSLVFAPLVAGTLALAVWRDTIELLKRSMPATPTGALGAGFALGAVLGFVVSLPAASTTGPAPTADSIRFYLLWGAALAVGVGLALEWTAGVAMAWYSAVPRPAQRNGLAVTLSLVMLALFAWFALMLSLRDAGALATVSQGLLITGPATLAALVLSLFGSTQTPFTTVGLMALFAYPLALRRRVRWRDAIVPVVFLGCMVLVVLAVSWTLWKVGLPASTKTFQVRVLFYVAQVSLVIAAQAVAAGVIAARGGTRALPHALFVAFLVGSVGATLVSAFQVVAGNSLIVEDWWTTYADVVHGGMLVALATTAFAAWVGAWLASRRALTQSRTPTHTLATGPST